MQVAMPLIYMVAAQGGDTTFSSARRFGLQLAIILVYFVPTILAQKYQHPKQPAILLLNIALGWTVVGWVVALIWALKGRSQA